MLKQIVNFGFLLLFVFAVAACNQEAEKQESETTESGEKLEDVKKEFKDLTSSVDALFMQNKEKFTASVSKVLDKLQGKFDNLKSKIESKGDNPELKEQLSELEKRATALQEELKQMGDKTGKEFRQAKKAARKEFKDIQKELEDLTSKQ